MRKLRHINTKMSSVKIMASMKFPRGIGKCRATYARVALNLIPKRSSAT